MSKTQSKPLTLKGILALVAAGVLYLIAQLTGIDLTGGKAKDDTTAGPPAIEEPAAPGSSGGSKGTAWDPGTSQKAPEETTGTKQPEPAPEKTAPEEPEKEEPKARDDRAKIAKLFRAMRSDVIVESEGEIVHILPQDNRGSRHQLFLVELSDDLTLKISHNIDIAPKVPIQKGDMIRFHGEYEYNDKGGVVHWTHRNTGGGSHEGGWLLHKGKKYQ